MSNCPFCNLEQESSSAESNSTQPNSVSPDVSDRKRPGGFLRRAWQSVQWLFPTALLVLMPKCPLCVAAYVALFTGVGITATTARGIQILMLVLCVASLAWLAIGLWRRRLKRRGLPDYAAQLVTRSASGATS
jgi:hypothetical protein